MEGIPRLVAILIAHTSADSVLCGFARGLGADERAGLLGELARRARRPDGSAAELLRALLRAAPLRLQAAREAVRLMRAEVLSGKAGLLCLSELRIAVLQHWERCGAAWVPLATDDAAANGAELAEPAEQRLSELLLLCDDLLAALLPTGHTPASAFAMAATAPEARSEWGAGCAMALQLLPVLLRAADAMEAELREARALQVSDTSEAARQPLGEDQDDAEHSATEAGWPSRRVVGRLLESDWGEPSLT